MRPFLIIISFLLFAISIQSQESLEIKKDTSFIEQKSFDKKILENYRNSGDFNYDEVKKEPNFLQKIWNWIKKVLIKILTWILGDFNKASGVLAQILRIIPYIIALLVMLFLIKMFLRVNTRNIIEGKTNISAVKFNTEEELIKSENLEELIKEAINNKNYRLSVRYYYLYLLQQMTEQNIIVWRQQKTNEDYIKEIKTKALQDDFIRSTRLYDFVWYGNFYISEDQFSRAEKLFNNMKAKING